MMSLPGYRLTLLSYIEQCQTTASTNLAGETLMTMSVETAAQALREATRETVRRYSIWYLIQGVLMVIAGIVALLYPFVSSVALAEIADYTSGTGSIRTCATAWLKPTTMKRTAQRARRIGFLGGMKSLLSFSCRPDFIHWLPAGSIEC
jgi:hypothetical protein